MPLGSMRSGELRSMKASVESPPSPQLGTGRGYAAVCGGVRADAVMRPESVRFVGIMDSKPQNLRAPGKNRTCAHGLGSRASLERISQLLDT
jgi:hypothetical protein